MEAITLSQAAVNMALVREAREWLRTQRTGVLLVAQSIAHQQQLYDLLLKNADSSIASPGEAKEQKKLRLKEEDIFLVTRKNSISLTDESVARTGRDYKILIAILRHSGMGWNGSRLKCLYSGVYPSNPADRAQMEGRVDRIGQKARVVPVTYLHCGTTTFTLQRHQGDRPAQIAFSQLPKALRTLL